MKPPVDAEGAKPEKVAAPVETTPAKKGKGGKDEVVAAPVESLAVMLHKELAKLPKFDIHPFKNILIWTYFPLIYTSDSEAS